MRQHDDQGSPLHDFSDIEKDTLKEVGNISLGSSATILSQLINRPVRITTPSLSYRTVEEIKNGFPTPCVMVGVEYTEGLAGKNLLIIDTQDAAIIGQLMMMEDPDPKVELSEIHLSAVSESMNQMMGAAATSMSDMFDRKINISFPQTQYQKPGELLESQSLLEGETGFIQVSFRLEVPDLIDSELLQLMPVSFARLAVDYLLDNYRQNNEEKTKASHERGWGKIEKARCRDMIVMLMDSAAKTLSDMTSKEMEYEIDSTVLIEGHTIHEEQNANGVIVQAELKDGLVGEKTIFLDEKEAALIGQLMMGEEPTGESELNEMYLSALNEAFNMMFGAFATELSKQVGREVSLGAPRLHHMTENDRWPDGLEWDKDSCYVKTACSFALPGGFVAKMMHLLPLFLVKEVAEVFTSEEEALYPEAQGNEEKEPQGPAFSDAALAGGLSVEPPEDEELSLVKHIKLEVSGIAGCAKMPLAKVLRLGTGSVVELDKEVGEDVDVLVNGKQVAKAEIVAVGQQYGLRVTKIYRS